MFTSKCQQQFQYKIYFGSYMKLASIDTVYLYLLFFLLLRVAMLSKNSTMARINFNQSEKSLIHSFD